jgi:hypothetical protein
MIDSFEKVSSDVDLVRWGEEIEEIKRRLCSIASRPQIAKLMREFGMAEDPLAENNSLYEHFQFLLTCGVWPPRITLRVLSRPNWLRRSLELRRDHASRKVIGWTLTDQGRLLLEGSSPVFGKVLPWILNRIVDLFKESMLSRKIWSGLTALLLFVLGIARIYSLLGHGEHFLLNSLLVIACISGASGFACNLFPAHKIDENAQQTIASTFLLFLGLWLLAAAGWALLATVRIIVKN